MKEPKIYFGPKVNSLNGDYDIFIFVSSTSDVNKNEMIAAAKFKFIELSERKGFIDNPLPPLKKSNTGIRELPEKSIRQKRKRIGQ